MSNTSDIGGWSSSLHTIWHLSFGSTSQCTKVWTLTCANAQLEIGGVHALDTSESSRKPQGQFESSTLDESNESPWKITSLDIIFDTFWPGIYFVSIHLAIAQHFSSIVQDLSITSQVCCILGGSGAGLVPLNAGMSIPLIVRKIP